jgi:hypothetical protein
MGSTTRRRGMPEPENVEAVEPEAYVDPEVVAHSDDSDDGPCGVVLVCGVNAAE